VDKPLRQYRELLRSIKIGEPALVQVVCNDCVITVITLPVIRAIVRVNDPNPVFETEEFYYVPLDVDAIKWNLLSVSRLKLRGVS